VVDWVSDGSGVTDQRLALVPFWIYRYHGANAAIAQRDVYRDECVKVLQRYTPIIPEDMKCLSNRVIAKHPKAIGFGHLVDKNMGSPLKMNLYNHSDGLYFTHEQN
jgi:hypothetical protein